MDSTLAFTPILRVCAVRGFLDLRNDIAREASTAGLTEDRLSELLDD